ncbi:hypothetical protein Ocepr_2255 (plasmid) [Oceanithermus profundus DSM 14977]|uniref:DUF6094 domain-containing protein n=1 Tax=Oceanithermus profundus (strain DSM 14977 / NBRC 100410 / VKM B-2274 / 506) TaxID=670487 RepID=E4UAR8_OCEP5|nr:DUF6094 domain-containing protein [Oceanithermus profundus]ADR37703.1 hypothetical protein Ocepr_2255 [Oceanithermus profundus DSM 14977]
MRHAGRVKAGFFPTPLSVIEWIGRIVLPPMTWSGEYVSLAALDPAVGDGEAFGALTGLVGESHKVYVKAYGIELDRHRATKARGKVEKVAVGNALGFEAAGFSLLFLNPPYDDAGGGKRLEVEFLERFVDALVPQGVLVYIIPEYSLPAAAGLLLSHYEEVRALRFPEPEYRAFRQVVVLGRKRKDPVIVEDPRLEPEEQDLRHVALSRTLRYTVPKGDLDAIRLVDRGLEPEDYLKLAARSPAWDSLRARARSVEAPAKMPPLVPLSREHLALLVAAGHLNETVVATDEGPLLLRGRVEKVREELPPEDDGERKIQLVRERYVSTIQAFNLQTHELKEIR